ncbi:LysR family transcriptional regulator [Rugosimonospora africana]|uniref:LysR family transcriptional regulator n=1 Tax=Rugosimonospora africana TaxID=556532 RepID=A0A8J3QV15_9ACTN|nr:LysR family transcriptional regulator [Rugosimonospora africana]GIH16325.1 LysR family transcriptional regulator [Rugosimonospora africana]
MLDARRLRLLRDLSVHGTVAATAKALHLTAPAVSQQLAALEKDAGVSLLEKRGRTLRLTAAGSLLVEHAEVVLAGLAAAEADLRALRDGGRGWVRVAAFPSAARALLPGLRRRLGQGQQRPPELSIVEHEPGAATAALRHGEVDLAVVHAYSLLPRAVPPGCEQHHLLDEPVVLAMPEALAARLRIAPGRGVDLARLAGEDWLLPGPETSCHELVGRACGAAGFVPRPVAVASDFSVLVALVAAGAGVAAVPRMALPADTRGVSLHPLRHPVTRTVSALTAAGAAGHPRLRRVLDCLRDQAAALADTAASLAGS